jgi:uncharacterized membrane protein YkvA (DUF1232 family)
VDDDSKKKTDIEPAMKYADPDEFSEPKFWRTVRRHASRWGRSLLLQVLTIYYCMIDPATPTKSKAVIAGALAYTIFPADLIPDLIPAVGWSDDAAMIAWAGYEVVSSINEKHQERARAKVSSLLGDRASAD